MKITKFGQSCLLIEESGARILLDPGSFSTQQNSLKDLDAVLITHDHGDHVEMSSIKEVVAHNPEATIYTTETVHDMLAQEGIASEVIKHGESVMVKDVKIEGVGEKHALLLTQMPQSQNVGFMINDRFFYPGDALTVPGRAIEVLALPAAAPWATLAQIVDYATEVKPTIAFPVHDSILANPGMMSGMMQQVLGGAGIDFRPVELDTVYEF